MKNKLISLSLLVILLSVSFASAAYYDQYSVSNQRLNSETWKYKYDYDDEDLKVKVSHSWTTPQYNYYRENYQPDYGYYQPYYQTYQPTYQSYSSSYQNSYRFSKYVTEEYKADRGYNSYYNSQYSSQDILRQASIRYQSNSQYRYGNSYTYNPPIYSPPYYY